MHVGSCSEITLEITLNSPVQRPVHGAHLRDETGSNADFEAAFETILKAVEGKDYPKVQSIIQELSLAEQFVELQGAARSARLSVLVGQRGLIRVLHHAAEYGYEDLLRIVLEDPEIDVNAVLGDASVEVHHPCKGCTALILACWKGHASIVSTLLQKGADVHIYTRDGLTCLHMAAFSGHVDVVNFLLHGKNTRAQWQTCHPDHMAIFYRKREVGLHGNHDERLSLFESFSKSRWALIERRSAIEKFTAFHMAAGGRAGNLAVDIAESILEALMASVLVFYRVAKTLGEAYRILWHEFLLQVRNELYDLVNGEICRENILQSLAAYGNHDSGLLLRRKLGNEYEGFVQGFVELVSYTNARDAMGRTALHHTAWQRRSEFVELLMWDSEFGSIANANIADLDGHTALHLASWMGFADVVKELMSYKTSARDSIFFQREKVKRDWRRELDNLFGGASYLQPNATTNPSGRSREMLVAIDRDATKLEKKLGHDRGYDRSGRSLLFIEVEAVFYYYMTLEARDVEGDHVERKKWIGQSIWVEERSGVTPLHYAVANDHEHVVGLLMLHPKTGPFCLASDGQSPWTIAYPLCRNGSHLRDPTRVQLWLRGERSKKAEDGEARGAMLGYWRISYDEFFPSRDISFKNYFESRKFHQQRLLKQAIELARADDNDAESKDRLQILESQILLTFAFDLARRRFSKQIPRQSSGHYNLTLLQAAAFYGLGQAIEALLTIQTYRDHVNDRETLTEKTVLHFAVESDIDAVVALLREKNLNFSQRNKDGLTPLDSLQFFIDVVVTVEEHMINMEKFGGDVEPDSFRANVLLRGLSVKAGLRRSYEIQRFLMENPLLLEKLYRDRQVFADAASASLVGAALIASVTFGGFLQPPRGFVSLNTTEGFAAVEQHISVRVFWAFNSLSFYSAVATVAAGGGAVLPTYRKSIEGDVRMIRKWLCWTSALLAMSILCVLGAFTSAGFASLPNDFKYERNIIATAAIGLTLCVVTLSLFSHRLFLSLNPSSPTTIAISETFKWIFDFAITLALLPIFISLYLLGFFFPKLTSKKIIRDLWLYTNEWMFRNVEHHFQKLRERDPKRKPGVRNLERRA